MLKITKQFCIAFVCITMLASCSKDTEIHQENASFETELGDKVAYSQIETDVLTAVNEYRKNNGLSILKRVDDITFQADDHTSYMISKKAVNHDNFAQRYEALVNDIGARSVSENIGYGYRTAEAVVAAWIKSEGHKKNIEGDFTHFGISVDQDNDGKNYFTNIFVKR